MKRRDFIKLSAVATTAAIITPGMESFAHGEVNFTVPQLPYDYKALEPHIDTLTMEIHHGRHHKAYVDNLNKLWSELHIHDPSLENIVRAAGRFPVGVRNNAGGHWNHSFFWTNMKPNGGGLPSGKVAEAINAGFGSFENFKKQFNDAAKSRFGSGWAWLVKTPDGKLAIGSTANQDNPLMDVSDFKGTPVLGLDVWEHAYYLKYQNKRADYIDAWWNVVNWDAVAGRL